MNSENVKYVIKPGRSSVSFFNKKDVNLNMVFAGVYALRCIPTDKLYVGSSVHVLKRLHCHWWKLVYNKHDSVKLQHAFNKYGGENFNPELIEMVDISANREILYEREQYWLDELNVVDNGYNVCRSTLPMKRIAAKPQVYADIKGQTFYYLTAEERIVGGEGKWLCKCVCGNYTRAKHDSLVKGKHKSCGCKYQELKLAYGKHGRGSRVAAYDKTYAAWTNMTQAKHSGQKVKRCERWQDFNNFIEDMGEVPSEKHILVRLDLEKEFSPENCKWMTKKEKAALRGELKTVLFKGEQRLFSEVTNGVSIRTFWDRIKKGWSVEDALLTPPQTRNKK